MGVYDELGVKKLINAWGTVTKIGGSKMPPEVLQAMCEAAQAYVDINELLNKAGKRIAELLGCEAAFITSGAAAGLAVATAACMAGTDPVKIARLPDTSGMKNEVIILKCHRFRYDQAVRMTGAKLIEVGLADRTLPEEIEAAINERTAAILYVAESEHVRGSLPLDKVVIIAKKYKVPVIVDAAAELPPVENLRRYLDTGADLVIFSGGKDIRGPQSSGLILGNESLIKACAANSCPNHGIGRPMKVDKETVIGLLKAIEIYLQQDFVREMQRWEEMIQYFVDQLKELPGIKVWRGFPSEPGIQPACIPRAYIEVNERQLGMSIKDIQSKLFEGDPGIVVGTFEKGLVLNPHMLEDGEEKIIVDRFKKILGAIKQCAFW
ncbi:MAG: aminotransferase class V-fold PLP-dependent enzyme [Candidatus Hadarchaeum sp.]|uniref:aminotransferase class V-fold PLP-dependent enzyme n=1 Tax=Candidatus Hadarchaeum sp. TaxID=2883567 RepID=UPI00317689A8